MSEVVWFLIKAWAVLAVIAGCAGALMGIGYLISERLMLLCVGLGTVGGLILMFSN